MTKKAIDALINKSAERAASKATIQMKQYVDKSIKKSNQTVKEYKEETTKEIQKTVQNVQEKSDIKWHNFIGAMNEANQHKIDAIFEYVQDIPAIKEKLNKTFDRVDEIAEDLAVNKLVVRDHEKRIQNLEGK